MMPSAKTVKAKRPAIGRSASAAWAEVWMSVTPCACSVAAVVSMMNSAMMFEAPMPTRVSSRMRAIWRGACVGRLDQRLGLGIFFLVLHLLAGLPEEQVGADRGAEHGDDHGQIARPTS